MTILEKERSQSPASLPTELREKVLFYGGKERLGRYEYLRSLLEPKLTIAECQKHYGESVDDQRRRVFRVYRHVEETILDKKLNVEDAKLLRNIAQDITGLASPTLLHEAMFVPNISSLFSEEQQAQWSKEIQSYNWLGCYIQTELGHGSNLRALETTATFRQDLDMFEIHSPTLTSVKYWPGALANTANIGVIYARLIVHGKDYGVHSFLIQIRDFKTHQVLPGISLGGIGTKFGFNTVDNGFAKFDRVLIPRSHMAMKFNTLSKDGVYSRVKGAKQEVSYITMLQMRYFMIIGSGKQLSKAATIAIRYSAVRFQGANASKPNEEMQVLNYQSQQHRLLPRLAESYAVIIAGNRLLSFSHLATQMVAKGKTDGGMLALSHATGCAVKVFASELSTRGIEICRRGCGGHGYLQSSGLPELLAYNAQFVTAEGENYVLSQQTTKTLLKMLSVSRSGMTNSLPQELRFFESIGTPSTPRDVTSVGIFDYEGLFQTRLLCVLAQMESKVSSFNSLEEAIQSNLILSHHLSMCFGKFVLIREFSALLCDPSLNLNKQSLSILQDIFQLFCISQILEDMSDFLSHGCLSLSSADACQALQIDLLKRLRPHAVALVDAFGFSDLTLNSTLGRFDGNVYQALMESSEAYPNDSIVSFTEYLKPLRAKAQRANL
ncbi:peroxisomal acyl-coenzyme A oxidase [Thraustotheca clavata]|uniref:Acyl-coenzyme A oxidase n=1 Tax=Thraustotheca clavata TaxID=74557 RepID=A0A1V9ZPJ5_9STRA|nr:peroxisomal acyl-coenzyme A oxidase [Thraustotheca clavata]